MEWLPDELLGDGAPRALTLSIMLIGCALALFLLGVLFFTDREKVLALHLALSPSRSQNADWVVVGDLRADERSRLASLAGSFTLHVYAEGIVEALPGALLQSTAARAPVIRTKAWPSQPQVRDRALSGAPLQASAVLGERTLIERALGIGRASDH